MVMVMVINGNASFPMQSAIARNVEERVVTKAVNREFLVVSLFPSKSSKMR